MLTKGICRLTQILEVIPKFTLLLKRGKKLPLQGNGMHTRHFLYASDAADAFDTILHKGEVGQVYNVGSRDEVSNLDLCSKLFQLFDIDCAQPVTITHPWIERVRDRPFNDPRYPVDGSKLRALGWEQKISFHEGLQRTVDWYQQFGETWWGDISHALTAFPVLEEESQLLVPEKVKPSEDRMPLSRDVRNEMMPPASGKGVNGQLSETALSQKRMRVSSQETTIRTDVRVL